MNQLEELPDDQLDIGYQAGLRRAAESLRTRSKFADDVEADVLLRAAEVIEKEAEGL